MYRELVRTLRRRTRSRKDRREPQAARSAKRQATEWCERHTIDATAALMRLTGRSDHQAFEILFADELRRAREVAASCPEPMGGPGNLDLIYHLAEHLEARRIIETGVAYGWSSLAFLLSIGKRQGHLVSSDMPYVLGASESYVGIAVPPELRAHWTLLRYPDRDSLPRAFDLLPEIDMCHYDSDKQPEGREWAYPKLWRRLRPGGVLISDDVGDNLAFRNFTATVGAEPLIVATEAGVGRYTPSAGPARAERRERTKYVGLLVKA